MRYWDVSGPEVDAADAEPWDMPLAGMFREFSTQSLVRLFLGGGLLLGLTGLTGIAYALDARAEAKSMTSWMAFQGVTLLFALLPFVLIFVLRPRQFRRVAPAVTALVLAATTVLPTWGLAAAGPNAAVVVLAYVQTPLFACYMLRRPWAIAQASLLLICFAFLVQVQSGWSAPLGAWLFVAGNVVGTGIVVAQIAIRADELAVSEHKTRVELADLNRTLEERVDAQVSEIERLGGLRRFLAPQVADAVLSGDAEELTRPHRRRIAVFFCDLRGFTAFTNNSEPEEVADVLNQYFGTVGGLLQRYEATIGGYSGDGIMAYFGDPVAREDSALAAVEMTFEVRREMAAVVAQWQENGYQLSYGVGIAYGYATLGVIGFDGRYDYTPVGSVVNLAARLCGRATAEQVLLDHPTHTATCEFLPSESIAEVDLKGYRSPTKVYALLDA